MTTHPWPVRAWLIRWLLPTPVGEANDTDDETLHRARFVRFEAKQCRGRAGYQVRTLLMRARRAEWERRSCVAEVFGPCLGVLARNQFYVTMIRSNIGDVQMTRKRRRMGLTHRISWAQKREACFAPAYSFPQFLYQSATAPSWVSRIEHEQRATQVISGQRSVSADQPRSGQLQEE